MRLRISCALAGMGYFSAFSTARTEAMPCTKVHTPQMRWAKAQASRGSRPFRMISMPRTMEGRSMPEISDLSRAMREAIQSQRHNSPEALAASTSLTATEVRALMRGEIGVAPAKLAELPEGVRKAYAKRRAEVLEQVCGELRAGLSQAEKDRLAGLLGMHAEHRAAPEQTDVLGILDRFTASLKTA